MKILISTELTSSTVRLKIDSAFHPVIFIIFPALCRINIYVSHFFFSRLETVKGLQLRAQRHHRLINRTVHCHFKFVTIIVRGYQLFIYDMSRKKWAFALLTLDSLGHVRFLMLL